jgi:protein TonB
VADADVAPEITIAPTTFGANPVETLPAPPRVTTPEKEQVPFYAPRDVEPRLLNGPEIARLLEREYPQSLCDAGIEGTVLLWILVDEEGAPAASRVHTTSGYAAFDDAAREVARHMRFLPAQHRDKSIAVWIAQPFEFRAP